MENWTLELIAEPSTLRDWSLVSGLLRVEGVTLDSNPDDIDPDLLTPLSFQRLIAN